MSLCREFKVLDKNEILRNMSSESLLEWMAFISLDDADYKKELEWKVAQEDQAQLTQEELAERMKAMLLGLKNGER